MTSFGIDFGTTNSAAVKLKEHAEPEKYGDETGAPCPSIVAIDKATGEAIGGRDVWENRERYLTSGLYHVIQSVKWSLGKNIVWRTEENVWTPEDVAAFVLSQLSGRAARLGVEKIEKAAVTIPVDFPSTGRAALRRAAQKAGIVVDTFVSESTAAFMRYLPQFKYCHYVAVFDWGGGTLDVSVLEIRDNTILELSTDVMDIAGDVIDVDLARSIHAKVMGERRQSIAFESMSATDKDTLRTKCERAKCLLSDADRTDVILTSYGGQPFHFVVDQGWFESLISPHVELAVEVLAKAIEKARLSCDAIDRILVIGGCSKLKLLHEKLRNDRRFAASIYIADDAEWDVAHGAAIVDESSGGYETAESIGLVLSDNSFYELVSPGDRIQNSQKELSVSLIEDSRQANIIIAKRENNQGKATEDILTFGVDTLGFDLEENCAAMAMAVFRQQQHSQ